MTRRAVGQASRTYTDHSTAFTGRGILNGAGAHQPEHSLWPHLPILARIVWADTGLEEWIETTAMGWAGDLVYVDMRRTDYGVNARWLHATDVKRREIIPF